MSDPLRASDPQLEGDTTLGLLKRLMEELMTLLRQEMALATAEVSGAIARLSAGILSMATGGAVLFAGFLTLIAAAVLGLATVVDAWLAALLVGGIVTVIGITLVVAGRRSVDPASLKPQRSPESLRKDKDVLSRIAS
jgi:hypothetical protein